MKFKIGDKVKIKENLSCKGYDTAYFVRPMEKYKGKEAKITYISPHESTCRLDIDDGRWWWSEGMLELYMAEIRKSDLKDGDCCVFKNGNKAIKKSKYVVMGCGAISLREYSNKLEHNLDSRFDIVRIDRPVEYETIYKNDEILDSTEKKYLAAVIKPFKDKIEYIIKEDTNIGRQHISIKYNDGLDFEWMKLPDFGLDTMYVGMEVDKEYTLEELGL